MAQSFNARTPIPTQSEPFRVLVSVGPDRTLFRYAPEKAGCLGDWAELDTYAYRRGELSPYAEVLTQRQARDRARRDGASQGVGYNDDQLIELSRGISELLGMSIGESAVWDSEGGEVEVLRSEDPDGPFWELSGGVSGVYPTAVDVMRALGSIP